MQINPGNSPEEEAERLTKQAIREALGTLSYIERCVVELRLGEHTTAEIAARFDCSAEQVKEIDQRALAKLQALAESVR